MQKIKSTLGAYGERFFSLAQLKSKEIVTLGELGPLLQLSLKQEKELLSRLDRAGYIMRLLRGVYLIPKKLPPGGKWMPNEYQVVYELMKYWEANYQICGPLAFQKHGLSEQIPNMITIYNTKKSGLVKVGKLRLELIKVSPERLGSAEKIKLQDGKCVYISNYARTVMDAIYDWNRFNKLPSALDWITKESQNTQFIDSLIKVTRDYANINTQRRIGCFLDSLSINEKKTRLILSKLKKTTGWIPLDPNQPKKGISNKKWGVIINVSTK